MAKSKTKPKKKKIPPKLLGVPTIHQIDLRHCGPAAAAMILDFHGVPRPTGATSDVAYQNALFADVMSLSIPPTKSPANPGDCEGFLGGAFPNQQCYDCPNLCRCWYTSPQALQDVLNSHLAGERRAVHIIRELIGSNAVGALLKSIDKHAPPAVMVDGGKHWIVFVGYQRGTGSHAIKVGSRSIEGLFFCDPHDPSGPPLNYVPIAKVADTWVYNWLPIACAGGEDFEKNVAIVDVNAS